MAVRKKPTPADELAEVAARIAALVAEGEALSARQGDAEALIHTYADRRETALTLQKLGEEVEVPGEAEQARLQRFVADAKVEQDAIRRAIRLREEEKSKVIAAGLPYFDREAEETARAFLAACAMVLAGLDDLQAAQQANGEAWRRGLDGRKELGRDRPQTLGYRDMSSARSEVENAMRDAWPWHSEERWREFRAAEQAPPAARMRNAEAIAQFGDAA